MRLIPFPGTNHFSPYYVYSEMSWSGTILEVEFKVDEKAHVESLPSQSKAGTRQHGLWKKTCFEVFLRPVESDHYWEFNLAPDGQWNVWRLTGYRSQLESEDRITGPLSWSIMDDQNSWTLRTSFDLSMIPELGVRPLRAAVSAVVHEKTGTQAFWSLIHSQPMPDFHYPDHFTLFFDEGGW